MGETEQKQLKEDGRKHEIEIWIKGRKVRIRQYGQVEAIRNEMKKGTIDVCQNPDMEVVTGVREETP